MNRVAQNPGCRHACRLDPAADSGFVIEAGCPTHDVPGYTPFKVVWLGPHPCLVACLSFYLEADAAHEHVYVYSIMLGLN